MTEPVPEASPHVPSDRQHVPEDISQQAVPTDIQPVPSDSQPAPEASQPPDLRTALAAPIFSAREHGPHLRVTTPFTLPDGDLLTLFVLRHSDPPLLGDLGETLRWLRSHLFHDPPERQQQRVAEVCADLGVELRSAELRTHCRPHEPLTRALTRLAQACLRVADLRASLRPRKPPPFADEVEAHLRATLTARPLAIVRGDRIAGISATTWSVDFRVRTPERHLLIFLLASERRDHARKLAEHVVAACTDLSHLRKLRRTPVQFITVFDDRGSAWNDADERLVTPFATPFRWSERSTWVPALEAPDDDPDLDLDDGDPNDEPDPPFTLVPDPEPHGRMTLHARPATPADFPNFARLFTELGTGDPVPPEATWQVDQRPSTLFYEQDGELVAYTYFEVMRDLGYLRNLVVAPEHRGRGVGTEVMQILAKHLRARGCTRWCLNVEPDNTAAVRLYHGVGLRTVHRAAALRFAWDLVDALPGADLSLTTCPIDPAEDAAIEAAFDLPPGQLATQRAQRRVMLRLRDPADPGDPGLGFACFNPDFPGAYPFRVAHLTHARPLLTALRPHALPEPLYMQLVAEADEPLHNQLIALGATLRLELLYLRGDLP
ncbi:MAG: GNAT family N-acetyltransferase [Nannocystis sp.]|uniref:GNAT family N-acetyltransferase n=1 Tax=Nannocystis sp. TaxID=1962667 RepID=UPI002426B85D|nr:GNAT family N-acetyltransferase [Nannocystis sp.]MBK9753402.1 GNAT family N-acetyltransferase [Nannocystis sp.]